MAFEHFQIEVTDDGVAIVTIDRAGEAINTLDPGLLEEFEVILGRLEDDQTVRAVVIKSGKEASFVVGANIKWMQELTDTTTATEAIRQGQALFQRLEDIHSRHGTPVVAAVHGACLGGGNELILACSHRIASDHDQTQFGQPEVQLGIIPAAGATQRLPRLIGIAASLDMILKGRPVPASKARRLGLVDEVVPVTKLDEVAQRRAVAAIGNESQKPGRLSMGSLATLALEGNPLGRSILFRTARRSLLAETKGNYPAPERALEAVRIGIDEGTAAGYAAEARFFGELVTSWQSKALQAIFFATRSGAAAEAARPVDKVAVLGGGLMGAGIATVSTLRAGSRVRIKEVDHPGVAAAFATVSRVLGGRVRRGRLSKFEAEQAMLRITGTTDWSGFGDADLVIEAVFEDLPLKQRLLKEAEEVVRPDTVYASNTSSLPIEAIASAATRPANVVGMHYFSPVEKMPLLEVIVTPQTSAETEATAVAFGRRQGKTVIVVNDGTGFYTTRILVPYTAEAFHLLAEGASVDEIDEAIEAWGFPVGPLRLADEVGIDVGAKISAIMIDVFGERMAGPDVMSGLITSGRQGRKNRRGFYIYDGNGKRGGVDDTVYSDLGVEPTGSIPRTEIQNRITLALLNEAARCLEEGVLRSAADGDVGAVMGIGFPPFRGGPFFWIDHLGAPEVVSSLRSLGQRHGARFEPAPLLVEMAATDRRFHP